MANVEHTLVPFDAPGKEHAERAARNGRRAGAVERARGRSAETHHRRCGPRSARDLPRHPVSAQDSQRRTREERGVQALDEPVDPAGSALGP